MDIRSFFVKKNAQAPPATPVVKAEDSKRKIEDSGAEAQKKVRSSPPEAAATSIASSKEPRSRLSEEGDVADADLDGALANAVGGSSAATARSSGQAAAAATLEWSWEAGRGNFKPFDATAGKSLEAAFLAYKAGGDATIELVVGGGYRYDVDFAKMQQTNCETGKVRAIKRRPASKTVGGPEKKEPAALDAFRNVKAEPSRSSPKASAAARKPSPASKAAKVVVTKKASPAAAAAKPRGGGGGGGGNWGHSKPPPMHGLKHIPRGGRNCLKGKAFLVTGVMDSLEKEEIWALITKYGGDICKSVPKKKPLHFAIIGDGAGESKMKALEERPDIEQIDENGLLNMIRDSLSEEDRSKEPEVGTLITPTMSFGNVGAVAAQQSAGGGSALARAAVKPEPQQNASRSGPAAYDGPPVESQLWTEKYKPTKAADLVGNYGSVKKLGTWLSANWKPGQQPPKNRAVLLSGPPGIGKTSACHVILKEVGFDVIEFNASDVRSKNSVHAQIESMTRNRSMGEFFQSGGLSKKRVALIMDEVDGMSSGDRGGMQELIKIIQTTQIPIVCCCNDESHQKVRALKKYCACMPFVKPQPEMVAGRIMKIAKDEGMDLSEAACNQLFVGCNGDLRQMITNLQMWSNDAKDLNSTMQSRLKVQHKEVMQVSIFENVGRIMGPGPSLAERMEYFFLDIDMTPIWIHEAWPKQAQSQQCNLLAALHNMSEVAESLSDSDLINQKIRGEQNWSLLPSARLSF